MWWHDDESVCFCAVFSETDVSCFCFYCFGAFKKKKKKNILREKCKWASKKRQLVSGSEGLHRLMFNIRNNTRKSVSNGTVRLIIGFFNIHHMLKCFCLNVDLNQSSRNVVIRCKLMVGILASVDNFPLHNNGVNFGYRQKIGQS